MNALDPKGARGIKLTTANVATPVYSVEPWSPAIAWGIMLTNTTAGAVSVTMTWHDANATPTATSSTLLPPTSIAANATYWHDLHGMALDVGDQLRVSQGTADAIHAVVVFSETRGRWR